MEQLRMKYRMNKKAASVRVIKIAPLLILCFFLLTGCVNLLDGHMESITEHQITTPLRPPTEQITVSDYNEFVAAILRFIMEHETSSQFLFYHDGEDVQEEIEQARYEILNEHPIGAFAVAELTLNATRIVTHYEIDIEIEYKRTQEQLDSIVTVSSEQFMKTQLLNKMSEYGGEAIFRSALQVTEENITELVREAYYENPHRIVMLPIVTIEIFPEEGIDRIYLIQFGYTENLNMLRQFGELLTEYIQRNAGLAIGNTESEILLSLVSRLMESITFNEGVARTIPAHGTQNLAATAFGALFRGSAVGEGFAMAFKAIADELGFDCFVVLGYYDDMVHAWNIVSLYGDYYHIDVAMCVVKGMEYAFLKTDDDLEDMMYKWDRDNTVRCSGSLTLEDIPGLDDLTDPGNANQNGDEEEED